MTTSQIEILLALHLPRDLAQDVLDYLATCDWQSSTRSLLNLHLPLDAADAVQIILDFLAFPDICSGTLFPQRRHLTWLQLQLEHKISFLLAVGLFSQRSGTDFAELRYSTILDLGCSCTFKTYVDFAVGAGERVGVRVHGVRGSSLSMEVMAWLSSEPILE